MKITKETKYSEFIDYIKEKGQEFLCSNPITKNNYGFVEIFKKIKSDQYSFYTYSSSGGHTRVEFNLIDSNTEIIVTFNVKLPLLRGVRKILFSNFNVEIKVVKPGIKILRNYIVKGYEGVYRYDNRKVIPKEDLESNIFDFIENTDHDYSEYCSCFWKKYYLCDDRLAADAITYGFDMTDFNMADKESVYKFIKKNFTEIEYDEYKKLDFSVSSDTFDKYIYLANSVNTYKLIRETDEDIVYSGGDRVIFEVVLKKSENKFYPSYINHQDIDRFIDVGEVTVVEVK